MTGTTNQAWRRWTITAAVATTGTICAAGAIVASFLFLTEFALATGWPKQWAPLLPLCIDALAATAFLIYGVIRDRWVFAVGAGAVAASMLGNAASHWFASGWVDPGWLAFTLSGFVPAISIALSIFLLAEKGPELWAAITSQTTGAETAAGDSSDASSGDTTGGPRRTRRTTTGPANGAAPTDGTALDWNNFDNWPLQALKTRTDDQLLAWIHESGLQSAPGAELVRRGRVSKKSAARLRALLDTSNDSTVRPLSEPVSNGSRP